MSSGHAQAEREEASVLTGAEDNMGEAVGGDELAGEMLEAPTEEVGPRRHMPTPEMPSASAIAQHRENHLPYASWCDQCVEGRGR